MKRRRRSILFALIALLIAGIGVFLIVRMYRPKPKFYPGFGVQIPAENVREIGIDVSHHQGKIFWDEVVKMRDQQRRISFVFIRALNGCNLDDKCFQANWEEAGEAGLHRGAYHYFQPDQSARAQAERYLERVALTTGDIRPVLDVEERGTCSDAALRDSICAWLSIVGSAYHTAPVIYTGSAFYNQLLKGYFDDYPLWIAHYKASRPTVRTDYQFWQFSDRGRANGISGPVDFNVFCGDSLALFRMR